MEFFIFPITNKPNKEITNWKKATYKKNDNFCIFKVNFYGLYIVLNHNKQNGFYLTEQFPAVEDLFRRRENFNRNRSIKKAHKNSCVKDKVPQKLSFRNCFSCTSKVVIKKAHKSCKNS